MPQKSTPKPEAAIERQLVREWREAHALTLEQLGRGFRPVRDRHRVADIENKDGSMTVALVLEVIAAFGRVGKPIWPGDASDRVRLSVFFAGPNEKDARAALVKAANVAADLAGGGQS